MGRAAFLAVGLLLCSAGTSLAQTLPEGTFASDKDGCTKLAAKTPTELGEQLDFEILTKKGLTGYQQICDFVNVYTHDSTSWVATAFCDEGGYTYPDLFSIKQTSDGKLNVTRMTDLTDQGSNDNSDSNDDSDQDADKSKPSDEDKDASTPDEDQGSAQSYDTFVKCESVKP